MVAPRPAESPFFLDNRRAELPLIRESRSTSAGVEQIWMSRSSSLLRQRH
jgi:hypothetical protein